MQLISEMVKETRNSLENSSSQVKHYNNTKQDSYNLKDKAKDSFNNFKPVIKDIKNNIKTKANNIKQEIKKFSTLQDIGRLFLFGVHLYFLKMIFEEFGFGAKIFLFLTTITFYINATYFLLMSINSIYFKYKNNILLNYNTLSTHYRIGFILSVAVMVMYWGLYFKSPDMLGDAKLPLYFDMFLHGGNFCVMIIDKFIIDNSKRIENKINWRILFLVAIGYFAFVYTVFLITGFAVYPLLAKLTIPMLGMLVVLGYTLFLIGNLLYLIVNM